MLKRETRLLDRKPARSSEGERDRQRANEVRCEAILRHSVHHEELLHGKGVDVEAIRHVDAAIEASQRKTHRGKERQIGNARNYDQREGSRSKRREQRCSTERRDPRRHRNAVAVEVGVRAESEVDEERLNFDEDNVAVVPEQGCISRRKAAVQRSRLPLERDG